MKRWSPGVVAISSQRGRGLGQDGLASFLKSLRHHPGGIEDGLVEDLSGHLALPDLVPRLELGFHVALGVDLRDVGQVGLVMVQIPPVVPTTAVTLTQRDSGCPPRVPTSPPRVPFSVPGPRQKPTIMSRGYGGGSRQWALEVDQCVQHPDGQVDPRSFPSGHRIP